jgi:hypothetical protein
MESVYLESDEKYVSQKEFSDARQTPRGFCTCVRGPKASSIRVILYSKMWRDMNGFAITTIKLLYFTAAAAAAAVAYAAFPFCKEVEPWFAT